MGRAPCCEKEGLKKGPWTPEEDQKLIAYIQRHGHGSWRALPKNAGLLRCGKSCRLRWTNYLRPDIKRGRFSIEEEQMIIQLHAVLGNRWSAIASHLPGRTDNEIKNYWNTHLKKRLMHMGIDPVTHRARCDILDALEARPFLSSALSHMMQWENARLEAEARLASEYYRLAKTRQSILDAGASFMDLDTIRRRLTAQGLALNNNSSSSSDIDALKFLPDWDPSVDDSGVLKEMQQISFCVGDQEGSVVTEGHSSSSYNGTTPQSEGLLDDHQSIFQTDKFNFEGTCPQNSDMTHFMDEDALFQQHQNLLKLEIDPIPGLSSCSPPSLISQPDCFTFSDEQLLEQDHLPNIFDSEQEKKDSVSHLDLAVWSDQEAVQSKDYWSSLLKIVGSSPSL